MLDLENGVTVKVALRTDRSGAVRIGRTRVSLLSVLNAFLCGETPEQIVQSFPSLDLSDVYAVIGFYLANRNQVDGWLKTEREESERIRQEIEAHFDQSGIRERLLKRKAERRGSE